MSVSKKGKEEEEEEGEEWPIPSKEPSVDLSFVGVPKSSLADMMLEVYEVKDIAYYCKFVQSLAELCADENFWLSLYMGDKDYAWITRGKNTKLPSYTKKIAPAVAHLYTRIPPKQKYRKADTQAYFEFLSDKITPIIVLEVRQVTSPFGEEVKISEEQFVLKYHKSPGIFYVERGGKMEFTGGDWNSLVLYITYFFDIDLSSNPPRTEIIKRSTLSSITDWLPGINVSTFLAKRFVKIRGALDLEVEVTTKQVIEGEGAFQNDNDSFVLSIDHIEVVKPIEESIPEMASKVRRISTAHYQNKLNENLPKAKKFPGGPLQDPDPSPLYDRVRSEQISRRKLAWSLLSPLK